MYIRGHCGLDEAYCMIGIVLLHLIWTSSVWLQVVDILCGVIHDVKHAWELSHKISSAIIIPEPGLSMDELRYYLEW